MSVSLSGNLLLFVYFWKLCRHFFSMCLLLKYYVDSLFTSVCLLLKNYVDSYFFCVSTFEIIRTVDFLCVYFWNTCDTFFLCIYFWNLCRQFIFCVSTVFCLSVYFWKIMSTLFCLSVFGSLHPWLFRKPVRVSGGHGVAL